MSKLENASGNFLKMVECVQNGEAIQWKSAFDAGGWSEPENTCQQKLIIELVKFKNLMWRKKPDAFEEAYYQWFHGENTTPMSKEIARHFWNAAMEHKE